MIKQRAWPVRAMYMLIAAALAISLIIVAAPAQKVSAAPVEVKAEWTRVATPTLDGFVLTPESTIIDYALAEGGDVAYAIIYGDYTIEETEYQSDKWVLKSENGAATWEPLNEALEDALVDDNDTIVALLKVACDADDSDFVAVALVMWDDSDGIDEVHVFISVDGGENFEDTGEVEYGGASFEVGYDDYGVFDFAVSPEVDGEHDIAIAGTDYVSNTGLIFRCTVDGDDPGNWVDARDYDGWDDDEGMGPAFTSEAVVAVQFSPKWGTDLAILAVTVTAYNQLAAPWVPQGDVYLQTGTWIKDDGGWNNESNADIEAVLVEDNIYIPPLGGMLAGIATPEDYSAKSASTRVLWVWVNYVANVSPWWQDDNQYAMIYKIDDDQSEDVGPKGQVEDEEVWLASVSYLGTIAKGKAIAGLIGKGIIDRTKGDFLLSASCCEGVQVYRNNNIAQMEICCYGWDAACKPPTGIDAMAVSYVSEDKAYAVALKLDTISNNSTYFGFLLGSPDYDEGAWSVNYFDDGDTWNQISLIDTYIDYFSDVAVSPDCNKTFAVSANPWVGCECDSVWFYSEDIPEAGYDDYNGYWMRTWCGKLTEDGRSGGRPKWGLLRLAPEELEYDEVQTVYLVDYGSNSVYYNSMETLACWTEGTSSIDHIVDLAVKDASTIFALADDGEVAMSDDYGASLTWTTEPVESEVGSGHTIAVWSDDDEVHILVGGKTGLVSYSDDFDPTDNSFSFTELDEPTPIEAYVTVAFDSYFGDNDTIYAAVDGNNNPTTGGIYLWVLGESEDWTDIDACHEFAYTGLVLDRAEGNDKTSDETGGVLYASYYYRGNQEGVPDRMTGVARCLTPIVEICCDVGEAKWDYLYVTEYDTPTDLLFMREDSEDSVGFRAWPDALKICGCLTTDSNSKLFAIDYWQDYDMDDGEWGAVWTFEDCYAKQRVELISPDDGDVIPADPCECDNIPFTLKWVRLCDACCYEIEFALDEDFTEPVDVSHWYSTWYEEIFQWIVDLLEIPLPTAGGICDMNACWYGSYCPQAPTSPSMWVPSDETFTCEFTYYWRVTAVSAESGQCIRSWPSAAQSFTIAPSVEAAKLELIAPAPGATGVGTKNVGFSWDILATVDEFDWVLKKDGVEQESATVTGTYYQSTITLDYGTTYSWKVTAKNEADETISESAEVSFTTAVKGEFCCPQCGLCFDTQEELEDHIADAHPAQAETPFWVWVVIGIGAVLVIVVIVLIFRTRRV